MTISSEDLELFALVAREQSISRAALQLGLDQSTISRKISGLEHAADGALFRRSGHGVRLTERGKTLLSYAGQVSSLLSDAQTAMRKCSQDGPSRLRIAAQPTIARMLFPAIFPLLRERYPSTRLHFIESLAAPVLEQIAAGEIDLSILYVPDNPRQFIWNRILREEVRLITPANFFLRHSSFDPCHLPAIPLILPSTHHGLRILVEHLANRLGVPLNIVMESDGSNNLILRMVRQGYGCTILPLAAVADDLKTGAVKSVPFDPPIVRDIAITWPRKSLMSDELSGVIELIRDTAILLAQQDRWPDVSIYTEKSITPALP